MAKSPGLVTYSHENLGTEFEALPELPEHEPYLYQNLRKECLPFKGVDGTC
jgi:hypothetical protein